MSDTHYTYRPGTIAAVIHEHVPLMCVHDVDRLADAIKELGVDAGKLEDEYQRGWGDAIGEVQVLVGKL